jgi:hypothetical protein
VSSSPTFGRRFLTTLRSEFKTTAGLDYAVVEDVAQADRNAFLAILHARPQVPAEFLRLARTGEPEALARRLVEMQAVARKEQEKEDTLGVLQALIDIFLRLRK